MWIPFVVLIATAALVTAVVTDVGAHDHERAEIVNLAAARQRLAGDRAHLSATSVAIARGTAQHQALEGSIDSTVGQLNSTDGVLAGVNAFAGLQGSDVKTLQACLGGVESAFQAIGANGNARAAQDIAAVSGPCASLAGGATSGLAYPFDFPDPDVLVVNGTYFAYATNSVAGNIQIIASTDRTHWTAVGNALPTLPTWAVPNATWAPGVAQLGGTFLLYYAVDVGGPGGGEECISVATATQPQGPFVDSSSGPLECQPSLGGSIDPFPFVDANGTPYLLWKSNGGAMSATIWSQPLAPQGTSFVAGTQPSPLLHADKSWEGGDVEAPDMVNSGGRYFLFFSGNYWSGASYAEGVAGCTGPLGPCTDLSNQPILATGSAVAGPGGGSVFTDPSGAFWIAFHGYIPGAVGYPNSRDLFIRPLDLSGFLPVVG